MMTGSRTGNLAAALAGALLLLLPAVDARAAATRPPRVAHTTSLLPTGDVLITGGINAAGTLLDTAELMLASKGPAYLDVGNMNTQRSSHTATVMANGCVLVAGGWNGAALGNADIYDPATKTFVTQNVTGLTARYNHTATLLNDGRVLLCGGMTDAAGTVTPSCNLFTPTGWTGGTTCDGSFSAAASLQQARALHTATLLKDGKVWIAGGANGGAALNTTERYTPVALAAGSFSSAWPLNSARYRHTATMLGDGKILVAGGFNGQDVLANKGILDTLEIYDPIANAVTPAASMNSRRELHASTLHADGSVKLLGGLGNITTSYLTAGVFGAFNSGSQLTDTPHVPPDPSSATITGNAAVTTLNANFYLSKGVVGQIRDGEIWFSSPSVTFPSGVAYFVPAANVADGTAGLRASLDGVKVDCDATACGHIAMPSVDNPVLSLLNMNNTGAALPTEGNVYFTPLDASLTGTARNAAQTLAFSGGPLTSANTPLGLTPASSNINLQSFTLTLSPELAGAFVTGSINVSGGTLTQASSYTVTLSGGSIAFTGAGPVGVDGLLAITNPTMTGVAGTVAWGGTAAGQTFSTPVQEQYPDNSGATVSLTGSITGKLNYVADRVDLSGLAFTVDVATVVIRSMLFGDAEIYDPKANQNTLSSLSWGERFGHTSTLLPDGDELIVGGYDCSGAACSGVAAKISLGVRSDALVLVRPESSPAAASGSLATARAFHTATLLTDGTILAAGGTNGTSPLATAEVFNTNAETFSPANGPMSLPRDLHTATLLPNGRVLIAGGLTTAASTASTRSADIYYPDTKLFIPTEVMISSRHGHTATLMPDGNVMAVGGYGPNDVITGTAEIYYSTVPAWRSATALTGANVRALHTATLLKDGRLMVVGGVNASGPMNSVCFYSGASSWDCATAALPSTVDWPAGQRLYSHTATLLADGRVLVVGGDDGFGETNFSQIYDPAANTWVATANAPLTQPRFGHTATYLPDGTVMISGGADRNGSMRTQLESFRVDGSSWVPMGAFSAGARGFHTMTLAPNGNLYAIGGSNGLVGGAGTSLYTASEKFPFSSIDARTKNAPPSLRQSTITATSPTPQPNASASSSGPKFSVTGLGFRGGTEASGGGAAAANSSFNSPRLILQQIEGSGGGSAQSNSGFVIDLTTAVAAYPLGQANLDAGLTVLTPPTTAQLPVGWYVARAGANAVYSNGAYVQSGPAKPAAMPAGLAGTNVTGTLIAAATVQWTWTAVADVDGYNVYQATSGVFIGTAAATGSPSFLQTNVPPNTAASVLVAAYRITGDGPAAQSGIVVTPPPPIYYAGGVSGAAKTTTSILWTWSDLGPGVTYKVYNSTSGQVLASPSVASFLDTNLATATARSIMVSAVNVSLNVEGPLSPAATVYTLADTPAPWGTASNISSLSTGSFTLNWLAGWNPSGITYLVTVFDTAGATVTAVSTTSLNASIPDLNAGDFYETYVYALNGDGIASSPLIAGSTYTLSNAPTSLAITANTPVSLSVQWNTNANSTMTFYQITYSSDAVPFSTNIATAVAFASAFNGFETTIGGLITSKPYAVRVQARNPYGQLTSFSNEVSTIVYNGGVSSGSLAGTFRALGASDLAGYIDVGSGLSRYVGLRSPGSAFPQDVRVVISSYSTTAPGASRCPNNLPVGIWIEPSPAFQPTRPVYFTAAYTAAELGSYKTSQVALMRFEPTIGACVPLETTFDAASRTFTAQLNHFSLYELAAVPLATNADEARLWPNPLRVGRSGYVTIDRIPPGSRVRVMTLRGETVIDRFANGSGILTWDATNRAGRPVASGLYLVAVEADGVRKILKLAVIR